LVGVSTADSEPKLVGRQVTQILSPLAASRRKLKFNAPDHQPEDTEDIDEDEDHEEEDDC